MDKKETKPRIGGVTFKDLLKMRVQMSKKQTNFFTLPQKLCLERLMDELKMSESDCGSARVQDSPIPSRPSRSRRGPSKALA